MNAATPTPNRPDTAGCSGCLRTMRQIAMATPAASAAMSAGCSEETMLTTTNTATGMDEATMPCTPPIWSSSVGIERSGCPPSGSGGPGGGPEVTPLQRLVRLADLVERVVEHL